MAVLVVPNSSQLGQPLQRLAASIAQKCIPVAVAINCWHDRESNDPAAPHPTIPAIRSQLSLCGLRIGCFTPLNIEWAAASRQLLPTESLRQLRRRNPEFFPSFQAPPTIESLQHLEKASKIELLEKFLLPSPTESFAPGGLEHLTLLSRLLKLIKTMP